MRLRSANRDARAKRIAFRPRPIPEFRSFATTAWRRWASDRCPRACQRCFSRSSHPGNNRKQTTKSAPLRLARRQSPHRHNPPKCSRLWPKRVDSAALGSIAAPTPFHSPAWPGTECPRGRRKPMNSQNQGIRRALAGLRCTARLRCSALRHWSPDSPDRPDRPDRPGESAHSSPRRPYFCPPIRSIQSAICDPHRARLAALLNARKKLRGVLSQRAPSPHRG